MATPPSHQDKLMSVEDENYHEEDADEDRDGDGEKYHEGGSATSSGGSISAKTKLT
jgi:hypothetical protein